jgi:hypothetical protein
MKISNFDHIMAWICDFWWVILIILVLLLVAYFTYPYWSLLLI